MNTSAQIELRRRRVAILFADVANYSRMMSQDELRTALAVKDRIQVFRNMLGDYSGELIDIAGDGIFLVFKEAVNAVSFAAEIQEKLTEKNHGIDPTKQIKFRIGINLGEVLLDDEEMSGDSINIASRIEAFAQPGRICISGAVYEDVSTKLAFGYEYLGAQEFKNIGKSVDVFQVHENAESAAMTTALRYDRKEPNFESIRDQSIVVLPFSFQGNDQNESWFADGLSDDITTNLSRFHEFFVIARGSASIFRDKEIPPINIGRELGVRYVVNGNVRKSGSRIRVTLQLLDAQREKIIWGDQYNRDIEDIFDLQDEITQIVVSTTAAQIEASERERLRQIPPTSLEAYGFVLKGQNHIFRYTQAEIRQARGLCNAALSIDPRYARALSAKSRTLNLDWRYGWTEKRDAALDDALNLAQVAIEIDASDARGYGELGFSYLYRKENDKAIRAYERALALNPNDADLMSDMADALAHSGRSEEAIELLQKAMRLNPFYPDQYIWHLGGAYFNLKRYEDTIRTIQTMQNPTEGRRLLAASYAYLGKDEEARAEAANIRKAHPNFDVSLWAAVQPDKFEDDMAHFFEGLKRAGL